MSYMGIFLGKPGTRKKLLDLAKMIQAAYTHDAVKVAAACSAAGPGIVEEVRWGPNIEDSFWLKFTSGGEILVIDSGTESKTVLLGQLNSDYPLPISGRPGWAAMSYYYHRGRTISDKLLDRIMDFYAAYPGGIQFIFVGHSLGAAECLVAILWMYLAGVPPILTSIVTFGAPRCLSPTAAANLNILHLRVHGQGDPITYLPPRYMTTAIIGTRPIPVPIIERYEHHGNPLLLRDLGGLTYTSSDPDEFPIDYLNIIFGYLSAGAGTHIIATYIARLGLLEDNTEDLAPPLSPTEPDGFDPPIIPPSPGFFFSGGSGMATIKCNIFLKHDLGQGWTEGFYMTGSSMTSAAAFLVLATNNRKQCLSNDGRLIGWRVSDEAVAGDSAVYLSNKSNSNNLGPCEAYYANGRYKWFSGAPFDPQERYKRDFFLGLVPDDVIKGGVYDESTVPLFQAAINAYWLLLKSAGNVCFRSWDKSAPEVRISGIALGIVAPDIGKLIVTTAAPHGIPALIPTKVKLRKFRWTGLDKTPHGTVTAKTVSANVFTVEEGVYTSIGSVLDGFVSIRTYIYPPVVTVGVGRAAARKRGRPFGLRRGRVLVR